MLISAQDMRKKVCAFLRLVRFSRCDMGHRIAPYDAIHVGAAAPTLPDALVHQLASPGRMFIPVGEDQQSVLQVDKDEQGNVTKQALFDVMVSQPSIQLLR